MKEKMNAGKSCSLTTMIFLAAGISAFLVCSGAALSQSRAVLTDNDCAKCHPGPVKDMTAAGGGGHGGVTCSGCHVGHPPEVKKPFPLCSRCHEKRRNFHFNVDTPRCLGCHTNPHRPSNISLKGAGNDACQICHGTEVWFLQNYVSKHTTLGCSRCHDVHRKIPQCTQCHKPHAAEMSAADCKNCHNAHMPKIEAFPAAITSQACNLCHKKPADLLRATASKHRTLACIGCHQSRHKFKPSCQDCHGVPHPEGILAKFPECRMCHNSPHDLNNWPEAESGQVAEETSRKHM